jgi:adiponectin receptor
MIAINDVSVVDTVDDFDYEREYVSPKCCMCIPVQLALRGWKDVPDWQKDNGFIRSGYRVNATLTESFWSIFAIHNETGNIWSHLLGGMLFLVLGIHNFYEEHSDIGEKWTMCLFFVGACTCFFTSAVYHACLGTTSKIVIFLVRCDFIGIILFIGATFNANTYYNFKCDSTYYVYTSAFVVTFTCVLITIFIPAFERSHFRPFRGMLFFSFGLQLVAPVAHRAILTGALSTQAHFYFICETISFATGVYLYIKRIPERYKAGKFDIWFNSHQLLHSFVVLGAFLHYLALREWQNLNITC